MVRLLLEHEPTASLSARVGSAPHRQESSSQITAVQLTHRKTQTTAMAAGMDGPSLVQATAILLHYSLDLVGSSGETVTNRSPPAVLGLLRQPRPVIAASSSEPFPRSSSTGLSQPRASHKGVRQTVIPLTGLAGCELGVSPASIMSRLLKCRDLAAAGMKRDSYRA